LGDINSRLTRLPREVFGVHWSEKTAFRGALVIGAVCGFGSLLVYRSSGYSTRMLLLWLVGLAGLSVFLWSESRVLPRIAKLDLVAPFALAAAVAPLYLVSLYREPVQVSSDEVAVMGVSEYYAEASDVDPFGVSMYLGRPTMLFLAWGRLGEALGGIDLYHMRLLHALVGLLTIAACYALFRQLLPRHWAAFATVVVGVSHSMFMISRLAMRENTALLIEVVAFALLLWGLRNQHLLATFWGGVIAGLGFYVYFPSRATFPLWAAFLLAVGLLFRKAFTPRRLLIVGSTALAGFVLMAAPIVIAESKAPDDPASQPSKDSLMLFELGRQKQMQWVNASTFEEAWKINIERGLTAFNNKVVDNGFIYDNYGHGFVDPLTGILLWFGVGIVVVRLVRRRSDEGPLLMLASFVILWLSFAFVVNKAPNYTRLLITLPFVAYFVTVTVRFAAERWRSVRFAPAAIVATALVALVAWNVSIAGDFIDKGKREGEPIGSTGRYVASLKDKPGMKFYLATSEAWPYHVWGTSMDRMTLFAKHPTQVGPAVDPSQLQSFNVAPPVALFMRREAWLPAATQLADRFPRGRIRNVTPDGSRVVLEVPS
jgi:Dolichyl-phosphate-mannose-protein mannosyltransferase